MAPPDGVTLRQVVDDVGVRAMCTMASAVFGDNAADRTADALLRRLALDDGMELWIAEADGRIIGAGRLEPMIGSEFAGIWGGGHCRSGEDTASTAHSPPLAPAPRSHAARR